MHRDLTVHLGNIMATPQKIKNKDKSISYRIFVNYEGKRESKRFQTRQLAIDWAEKRKTELQQEAIHGKKTDITIKKAIEDYQSIFTGKIGRSKAYDIERIKTYDIANINLDKLTTLHIINHCKERNETVQPQTAGMDMQWIKSVLKTMSAVNNFDYDDKVFKKADTILKQHDLIARSAQRTRIPTWQEMLKLTRFFKRKDKKSKIPMVDIMWFAYQSTRRAAEITRIEWKDNNNKAKTGMVRDAKDPQNKKGNHKRFKYEKQAWKIVNRQNITSDFIFPFNETTIGNKFDKACNLLGIDDLHFHDLRHAGTTRLFRLGYTIEQVQKFTLHEDWQNLKRYTNLTPEDIKDI